ncbi:MAG: DUF932 domain-containing protein, partial [Flavobacteriaceae bacterium]|nr:DUF932 domain-containing protein [Flavobacteriaceae bacterium]
AQRAVKVGHRTEFDAEQVKETLGLAHEKFEKYKEMAQFLGSRKFTAESLIQYYNEVFPNTSRKSEKAPVNTVAPVVSGTAATGETLSCTTGTWINSPTSYAYQWYRNNTTSIGGATSSTYVVQTKRNSSRMTRSQASWVTRRHIDPIGGIDHGELGAPGPTDLII